ncbi:IS110 family transposase [Micromonospora fulviviridis]|uniref:IS110 family transposase n=1 Tax=Micromonospora fulviviridis TaxID=47860 RepID=UPI0037B512A3
MLRGSSPSPRSAAVAAWGTTLTQLYGIGDVLAAKLLSRTGAVNRFRSSSASTSFCGVAPIEVSCGDVQRHRLSRAGDRQLNYALRVMAITQTQQPSHGEDYYQRNARPARPTEKPCAAANDVVDVVYRTMITDAETSLLPTA